MDVWSVDRAGGRSARCRGAEGSPASAGLASKRRTWSILDAVRYGVTVNMPDEAQA